MARPDFFCAAYLISGNTAAHCCGIAFQIIGRVARTIGDGCADCNIATSNRANCCAARCALPPTRTMTFNSGKSAIKPLMASIPCPSSSLVIRRVPFHHGTAFQRTVDRRGTPAPRIKLKIASAVGSSLSRETKPEPVRPSRSSSVIGPGFSNKKSARAPTPPSAGSKSGTLPRPCARKPAANLASGLACTSLRKLLRCARIATSRRSRGCSGASIAVSSTNSAHRARSGSRTRFKVARFNGRSRASIIQTHCPR